MFQELQTRESLAPTEIPWLPYAPTDWPLVRLKRLMRESKDLVGDAWNATELLALTKRGIVSRDINNLEGKVPASFASYQTVERNDLVFCLFDIDETPRTVGIAPHRGMITAAYTRFEVLPGTLPQFLELLFASLDDRKLLRPLYTGLRKTIRADDLLGTAIPLPSLDEQQSIVTYLAHAHKRITKAIVANRRLVALLEQQKRTVVNRAVTEGLAPDAPMTDSENPFLGPIPSHWRLQRFRHVATPVQRPEHQQERLLSVYLGKGVIPYEEGGKRVHAPSIDLSAYQLVTPGDLVMNNQQAWRGSVGVSRLRGIVSPAYVVAKLSDAFDSKYAGYLFTSSAMVDQYVVSSKGVGSIQRTLHWPYLRNALVPTPPLREQQAIVEQLEASLSTTDAALSRTKQEIELLREFRGRLTADVVTGRVDVRRIAARLPRTDTAELFEQPVELFDDEGSDEVLGDQEEGA